jgi:hypothetical protein
LGESRVRHRRHSGGHINGRVNWRLGFNGNPLLTLRLLIVSSPLFAFTFTFTFAFAFVLLGRNAFFRVRFDSGAAVI